MQIDLKSHIQKAKSVSHGAIDGIRGFFTPNRKTAIKNGVKELYKATETVLDVMAHPRRSYRKAPLMAKFAVLTGSLLLGHLGLLQLNKQEQKNKAKDIVRTHIMSVDGTVQENDLLLENARLAKRNFQSFIPTLTERQADSLKAQEQLSLFLANSIAYKKFMDMKLFLEENPAEETPKEWNVLRDSIDAMTRRGHAYGGAALNNLEEFSKLTKTYVAPDFYLNEQGLPVVHLGRQNAVLASSYELGQQAVELGENIADITAQGFENLSQWVQEKRQKKALKQELK